MGRKGFQTNLSTHTITVNKKQLIARVQRYMGPGATRSTASAAVDAVLNSIQSAALSEPKLHISKLGTFEYNTERGKMVFRPAKGFVPAPK